jgi:hypothetical protein
MTRCKHCLEKADPGNEPCPVCGIVPDKRFGNLSPSEKKARFHARGIRIVAMLHLIGACTGLLMLPVFPAPGAMVVLATINLVLAFGLARYSFWAYKASTVYYFLIGMVNVVSVNLGGIGLALIALYLIGNATSKAIFERRLPEM